MSFPRVILGGLFLLVGLQSFAFSGEEFDVPLPKGWSIQSDALRIVIKSPAMKLTPNRHIPGWPSDVLDRDGRFEMVLTIRKRISEEEHAKATKHNAELPAKYPTPANWKSKNPPWYDKIVRTPDFYKLDELRAYELSPSPWLPKFEADRKNVLDVYRTFRKNFNVYPTSPHADPKYYEAAIMAGESRSLTDIPVPNNWERVQKGGEVTFTSPVINLAPNPHLSFSSNARGIKGRFQFHVLIHPWISVEEHATRVKQLEDLGRRVPEYEFLKKPNAKYKELAKRIGPIPDFYSDTESLEIELRGSYLPASDVDSDRALEIYKAIRASYHVYPTSRHSDPKYYENYLRPFSRQSVFSE